MKGLMTLDTRKICGLMDVEAKKRGWARACFRDGKAVSVFYMGKDKYKRVFVVPQDFILLCCKAILDAIDKCCSDDKKRLP